MKNIAKKLVAGILWSQVKKLQKKNDFKIVVVAGSVGKTSTKLAIAQTLQEKYKVCFQAGNYNDVVSVPLVFFGQDLPSLFNPLAWLAVFRRNRQYLKDDYPFDVVVLEIGTDGPGQLRQFRNRLAADIGVLTAIAPEHMEFFTDIAAVAEEELTVLELSQKGVINKDLCPEDYLKNTPASTVTYAIRQPADIRITGIKTERTGSSFEVRADGSPLFAATHNAFSEPQLYSIAAAVAVARELGMDAAETKAGLANIVPVSGRMQMLEGVKGSVIIDDTYNASPAAVRTALDALYALTSPHKIAILGNMNELGESSAAAHKEIGEHCDPKQLELVVTIGPDANKYLAPAAEGRGCLVVKFNEPYSAGEYLKENMKPGSLILAKGSQNKVFAEEAVKLLLANPADSAKLVRQSEQWLATKAKSFKGVSQS